jgi:hypothetical protein
MPLGILIAIGYCSSPMHGQRCDAQYIFSDISPTPLKEANRHNPMNNYLLHAIIPDIDQLDIC